MFGGELEDLGCRADTELRRRHRVRGHLAQISQRPLFAGLFGPDVGGRLDDAGRDELAEAGLGPFGPAERPMTGYLARPAAWRASPDVAASWVERALAHVRSMPPKVKKPKPSGKR